MQRYGPGEIHVQRVEGNPNLGSSPHTLTSKALQFNHGILPMQGPQTKSTPATASSNPLNVVINKFYGAEKVSTHTLSGKLSKLIRIQKKLLHYEEEFIKDFNQWATKLPWEDSSQLVMEFLKCLECERVAKDELLQKQESLKVQFLNVYKRERKNIEIRHKRDKLVHKIKAAEGKVTNTHHIPIMKENLETFEGDLALSEDHYLKAINAHLKCAIIDYLITFQNTSYKYKQCTKSFFEYTLATSSGSPSPLQKQLFILPPNTRLVPDFVRNYQFPPSSSQLQAGYPTSYYNNYSPSGSANSRYDSKVFVNARDGRKPELTKFVEIATAGNSDAAPNTANSQKLNHPGSRGNVEYNVPDSKKNERPQFSVPENSGVFSNMANEVENMKIPDKHDSRNSNIAKHELQELKPEPINTDLIGVRPTSLNLHEQWN